MKRIIFRQYTLSILLSGLAMILLINLAGVVNKSDEMGRLFLLSLVASIMMSIAVAVINSLNFTYKGKESQLGHSFIFPIIVWSTFVVIGGAYYFAKPSGDPTMYFFSICSVIPLFFNIRAQNLIKRLNV